MTLPSQSRRTPLVTRGVRKRRLSPRAVLTGVVVVVVGVTIWAVAQWTGPAPAAADDGPVPSREQAAEPTPPRTRGDAALPAAPASSPVATRPENFGSRSLLDRARPQPAASGMLSGATIGAPVPAVRTQPGTAVAAREPDPQGDPATPLPDARPRTAPAQPGTLQPDPAATPASQPVPDPAPQAQPPVQPQPEPVRLTAVARALADARDLVRRDRPLDARATLNTALLTARPSASEASQLRSALGEVNQTLVFGPRVVPNDPVTTEYRVQPGDSLARIARRQELLTHWRLIQRVNNLSDPTKIRVDQRLKLVRGPFHAVVDKSEYRLDLYWGSPDRPEAWTFIRSFPVGLGADDGTPTGHFVVSPNKLENPGWVNPRNPAERYEPKDPRNPIGKFWVGLDGVGNSAGVTGYGIHGTIEPESIGRSMSMGCVRLADPDIALLYELLEERVSVVHIVE